MDRLKKRSDFLRAARARKAVMPGLVLQARPRPDSTLFRVGFTATKKVGNAVVRNRARRRLREAARLILPDLGRRGFDYVLIARHLTPIRNFQEIERDLKRALKIVHRERDNSSTKDYP